MKTTALFLIMLSGLISAKAIGGSPENVLSTGRYTVVRGDQNIILYSRWVEVSSSVKTRQVKAVFTCRADPEEAVALLRDDHSYTSWMNGTRDFSRMKTVNNQNWYSYVRYALPWPLNDMDCVLKYRVEEFPEGTGMRIFITGNPDYIAPVDGVNRIPHLEVEWIIKRTTKGTISVEYSQFSKQPSKFPHWIIDPIVQKNLIKSLDSFRGIVEKQHNSETLSDENIH
jgi:hypothetical protein